MQRHPVPSVPQVPPAPLRDAQAWFRRDLPPSKPPSEAKRLCSEPRIPSARRFSAETFQPQDYKVPFISLCLAVPTGKQGAAFPSSPVTFSKSNVWFSSSPGTKRHHQSSLDHDWGGKQQGKALWQRSALKCWTRGSHRPDAEDQHPPEPGPSRGIPVLFPANSTSEVNPCTSVPKHPQRGGREFMTCHEQCFWPQQSPRPQPGARSDPAPTRHGRASAEQN